MAYEAAPPEAAPAPGQDPSGAPTDDPAQGQDDIKALVTNVAQGLGMVAEVVSGAGAPPELAQSLQKMSEDFKSIMKQVLGGQAPDQPAQAAPMESGGKPGAVPSSPAMR